MTAATVNGVGIRIAVDDKALGEAFTRLVERNGGLARVALKNTGEVLLKGVRKRFDEQVAPDGTPWAPLNPAYKAGKRGLKILQGSGMRGGLLGSIVYQIMGNRLVLGTNKIYAAVHQLGATIVPRNAPALVFRLGGRLVWARKVTIPARPYLGISIADRQAILETIEDVANADWSGSAVPHP